MRHKNVPFARPRRPITPAGYVLLAVALWPAALTMLPLPAAAAQSSRTELKKTTLVVENAGLEQRRGIATFFATVTVTAWRGLDEQRKPIGFNRDAAAMLAKYDTNPRDNQLSRVEARKAYPKFFAGLPTRGAAATKRLKDFTEDELKELSDATKAAILWWERRDRNGSNSLDRNELPQREPREFRQLPRDRKLTGYARLKMDEGRAFLTTRFSAVSGARTTIRFSPGIPRTLRLLPGIYQIEIEINIPTQSRRIRDEIWEDEELYLDNGQKQITRVNPARIPAVIGQGNVIVAPTPVGKPYLVAFAGGLFRARAKLNDIKTLDQLHKDADTLRRLYDKTQEVRYQLSLRTIESDIRRIESYDESQLKDEVRRLEDVEKPLAEALTKYHGELLMQYKEFYTDINRLIFSLCMKAYLCAPGYKPRAKPYAANAPNPLHPKRKHPFAGKPKTLATERKLWEAEEFLSGNKDKPAAKGAWKRERWLKWLSDSYVPKVEALRLRFARLYGDPKAKDENARFEFGRDPNTGKTTFYRPKFAPAYESLKRAIAMLGPLGKAYANYLAEAHADSPTSVDYPFPALARDGSVADSSKPEDGVGGRNARRLFSGVQTLITGFYRSLKIPSWINRQRLLRLAASQHQPPPSDHQGGEGTVRDSGGP